MRGRKPCGCACDNFQKSRLGEGTERGDEILFPTIMPSVAGGLEAVSIKGCEGFELRVAFGAFDFPVCEIDEAVEVVCVTRLQERIPQHVAERGRQR